MRIKGDNIDIDYSSTKGFFDKRILKYHESNPYATTMYQDNKPELVKERNKKETSILLPKLEIGEKSRVLDVACGIGRWSDAINMDIEEYCGIDFCEEFINLAIERNKEKSNRFFYVSRIENVGSVIKENGEGLFDRILFIGCFLYLNDKDVVKTLSSVETVCKNKSIICIREPIGIMDRLTLKDQFSEELKDDYNAIYRTRNEFIDFFRCTLLDKGFYISEEDFLFTEPKLNNRKETSQYYFILKRK